MHYFQFEWKPLLFDNLFIYSLIYFTFLTLSIDALSNISLKSANVMLCHELNEQNEEGDDEVDEYNEENETLKYVA